MMKISEVYRIVRYEDEYPDNSIDKEQYGYQENDISHRRNTLDKSPYQKTKFREECYHSQNPENPEDPENCKKMCVGRRDKAYSNNNEIEHVPGIEKELPRFPSLGDYF